MELHFPRRGSICLPFPVSPVWPSTPDLRNALRRAGTRITDTVRRGSAPVRTGLYCAAGTVAGTTAALLGMDPAESASLGMNVAATAVAFWPPKARCSSARTEAV